MAEQRPGLTLQQTLRGHRLPIACIAWSSDGRAVSASRDNTLKLWNVVQGEAIRTLEGHGAPVLAVKLLEPPLALSGSEDHTLKLWNLSTGEILKTLEAHKGSVRSLAVTSDHRAVSAAFDGLIVWDLHKGEPIHKLQGHTGVVNTVVVTADGRVVSASRDHTLIVWDLNTGRPIATLRGHTDEVNSLGLLPCGRVISSADDRTLRLWDLETGCVIQVLEGHTHFVSAVSAATGQPVLASKSVDGTVRLWDCRTWHTIAVLEEPLALGVFPVGLAFDASSELLATLGEDNTRIRIWRLDYSTLFSSSEKRVTSPYAVGTGRYVNAKVVLVGDTGVGKSGLALALTGQKWEATESTHGRRVWLLDRSEEPSSQTGPAENREILLWDLAGQPGYRLIHQLHLGEICVALVIFDAHSESDPFAAVRHWDRALRQTIRAAPTSEPGVRRYLVAARTDRGGVGVSRHMLEELLIDMQFDGYFETSAKEGWGIGDLASAIRSAIPWQSLPGISSTILFTRMKRFLLKAAESGRALSSIEDLYHRFRENEAEYNLGDSPPDLWPEFDTCIYLLQAAGLIRRLNFGDLVLLQPELLDAYASALVNFAKDQPDGLGSVLEEDVHAGRFRMPTDARVADPKRELLLLIATVEDLLRHELVLREQSPDGAYLVFPSQFTREWPDAQAPQGNAVVYTFEGPVVNIYATLAVRLAHSNLFQRNETWRNASTYRAKGGGICGIFMRNHDDGNADLTVFFDSAATSETRLFFDEYVQTHLRRRSLPSTVRRQGVFGCPSCGLAVHGSHVEARRSRGYDWITCGVCETRISLQEMTVSTSFPSQNAIVLMDRSADKDRDHAAWASVVDGKRIAGTFDVFLCHNGEDKDKVKKIATSLMDNGILPWLDEWELRPGKAWQRVLEEQIGKVRSCAVFVGSTGMGPWQQEELDAFLREFNSRACPVIPILLPCVRRKPKLPVFLRGRHWVDFRKNEPDPLAQLIWGITGRRPPGP